MNKRESQWVHEDGYGENTILGIIGALFMIAFGLIQLIFAGVEKLIAKRK